MALVELSEKQTGIAIVIFLILVFAFLNFIALAAFNQTWSGPTGPIFEILTGVLIGFVAIGWMVVLFVLNKVLGIVGVES